MTLTSILSCSTRQSLASVRYSKFGKPSNLLPKRDYASVVRHWKLPDKLVGTIPFPTSRLVSAQPYLPWSRVVTSNEATTCPMSMPQVSPSRIWTRLVSASWHLPFFLMTRGRKPHASSGRSSHKRALPRHRIPRQSHASTILPTFWDSPRRMWCLPSIACSKMASSPTPRTSQPTCRTWEKLPESHYIRWSNLPN